MADKYLELIEGVITEREVITYSHGWQDAGKLIGLEADGRISITMMSKDVVTTLSQAEIPNSGAVITTIPVGTPLTIPVNYQLNIFGSLTVNGILEVLGTLNVFATPV